ncbi:allophanate hydrolase [Spirochaetia bacterium]|nr:allophanate hydrolase [Spirochaetia bacterium]
MGLTIIDPGILSTIQDLGRTAYLDAGFSPSGALDSFSARLANFLAGNSPGEAVIEMTMQGASMVFDSPAVAALTGAEMTPLLNGKPIGMNRAFSVVPGDILYTSFAQRGMRSYLAVSGGFDIAEILGSRSTNLRARIGGFKGRKLETKDAINFRRVIPGIHSKTRPGLEERVFVPTPILQGTVSYPYTRDNPLVLRVVEGKKAADGSSPFFTHEGVNTFYHSLYTIASSSDRMGIRLEGPAISSHNGTDIVSDGISNGAIQIPGSGKPIILLNDRQTIGGYAKIGTVITGDIWLLAQAVPGSVLRFERIDPLRAEKIYIKTERAIARLQSRFTIRTDYGICKTTSS